MPHQPFIFNFFHYLRNSIININLQFPLNVDSYLQLVYANNQKSFIDLH